MSVYVIAKRGMELLDTPVFHAGEAEGEEAVAIFRTANSADRYIDSAGWADEYEAGELDSLQLLCWLVQAYEEGTRNLAINPDWSQQTAGTPQEVIVIEDALSRSADTLLGEVSDDV